MALPQEILDLVQMPPVEDLVLAVLRDRITTVPVKSLIQMDQSFPSVVVHRGATWGDWNGDPRFLDAAILDVFAFTDGDEADADGALLSEAVRVVLIEAINKVYPGKGHLTKVRMLTSPQNVPDWDTATGPVQFADLPVGVTRYQTVYAVEIRKPLDG